MRFALLLILLMFAGGCLQASTVDEKAQAAVNRSRNPTADYSVFTWNEANTPDRGRVSEWSAEFHRGQLHRVETPLNRIIADCGKQIGTWLDVTTGKRVAGVRVAKAACGVNANASVSATRFLGEQRGRFGLVDRVELTDADGIRTYDIDDAGAIVAATITGADGTLHLKADATARLPRADEDIFSEGSLERSAVPNQYRLKPDTSVEKAQ